MTLIDEALIKAFGQTQRSEKRTRNRGPHFLTLRNEAGAAERRELYLSPASTTPAAESTSLEPSYARDGSHDDDATPRTEQLDSQTPMRAQVATSAPASDSSVVNARIDCSEAAATAPAMRSKWLELFRHEVTTDSPELEGWRQPPIQSLTTVADSTSRKLTTRKAEIETVGTTSPSGAVAPPNRDAVASPFAADPTSLEPDIDSAADGSEPDGEAFVFAPAWEVDAFRLPEVCRQIEHELAEPIGEAALGIVDAYDLARPVVTIGSWTRGEGRTTVAIVLARALARLGVRVALIDADESNPALAASLGLSTEMLDTNRALSAEAIADRCIRSVEDGFTLLPLADSQAHDAALESRIDASVQALRSNFDVIVVDLPAGRSDLCADTAGLHIVVRGNWIERVEQHQGVPVSLVDNFVDLES